MNEKSKYTQVQLTSPQGDQEVWWIPVPDGRAKVGEKIIRTMYDQACGIAENPLYNEEWSITQVCTTMDLENLPKDARVATGFKRDVQAVISMTT